MHGEEIERFSWIVTAFVSKVSWQVFRPCVATIRLGGLTDLLGVVVIW